ncbi:MAG: rod shape-determining protein RodA [Planctomycetes bacterium]|nr:rod shape-determining protein RodA [Planctomycetota bacterium]
MDAPRRFDLTRLGWGLAIPLLFLSLVGLASIHATDRDLAAEPVLTAIGAPAAQSSPWLSRMHDEIGDGTLKQIAFFATGGLLIWLVVKVGYLRIGRYAYVIYWLVLAMLVLLLVDRYLLNVPLISPRRATWRWIGFETLSVQPSEFMKLALVLALARYLRYRKSYRTWRGLIPPFLATLLPMALILKQPDLGTLLMLLPVLFVMLFVAGARLRHLACIILAGSATLPLFYYFGMHDYQRQRIDVLFRQAAPDEQWHMNQGFQLRQSKIALALGGAWGEGFGEGAFVRYGLLPEEHNDFIFAIIGNQWGFIGCALVILSYVAIVVVGLEVSTVTNDPFGRLLAVGVVVMIVMQALLNMCMTIGLAPITGMPLPFVSMGGSSLWTNITAIALLVNIAQKRPLLIANPPFEYEDDE